MTLINKEIISHYLVYYFSLIKRGYGTVLYTISYVVIPHFLACDLSTWFFIFKRLKVYEIIFWFPFDFHLAGQKLEMKEIIMQVCVNFRFVFSCFCFLLLKIVTVRGCSVPYQQMSFLMVSWVILTLTWLVWSDWLDWLVSICYVRIAWDPFSQIQ